MGKLHRQYFAGMPAQKPDADKTVVIKWDGKINMSDSVADTHYFLQSEDQVVQQLADLFNFATKVLPNDPGRFQIEKIFNGQLYIYRNV